MRSGTGILPVWEKMLETLGKTLLLFGATMLFFGALLWGLSKALGGRLLPGDIVIHKPGFTFFFPVVSSLLVSLLLTLIFWLIAFLRR